MVPTPSISGSHRPANVKVKQRDLGCVEIRGVWLNFSTHKLNRTLLGGQSCMFEIKFPFKAKQNKSGHFSFFLLCGPQVI